MIGAGYARLQGMQERRDAVVISAPLTPETEGLFERDVLQGMPRAPLPVNIARGGITDRDALVEALERGWIRGYAGDA